MIVTRFAPSPTGRLHLGHAFSALFSERASREHGGKFLLRIEDIDFTRCQEKYEDGIVEDLSWLGIKWEGEIIRQSERGELYREAAAKLKRAGLVYPCFCTRKDIQVEIANAGGAPHGPDGPVYPGTCRALSIDEQESRIANNTPFALRLDVQKAVASAGDALSWIDDGRGTQVSDPAIFGDAVIARKDIGTSYHLAVTVDDAAQGVNLITRGEDLFEATHLHRLLQALLDLPVPRWRHHRLLTDDDGKRLAKRDKAATLQSLREGGENADAIRQRLGFA